MSPSRWLLRCALALPVVLLAIVGYRTWRLEGAQVEIEDRRAARALALGLVQSIERWRDGEQWPGERLAGPTADPLPQRDPRPGRQDRFLLLRTEYDRHLERGGQAAALAWLESIQAADDDGEDLVAWADLQRAALLRAEEPAAASAVWTRIGSLERGRDARGLRFDLVARALLALAGSERNTDSLAEVAVALAEDRMFAEERATGALCSRLIEEHARAASAEAHRKLLRRTASEFERVHWNSVRRSDLDRRTEFGSALQWIQRGEHTWLVAGAATEAGVEVRGVSAAALGARLVGETTAEQLAELGFGVALLGPDERVRVSPRAASLRSVSAAWTHDADVLARVDAPAGIGAVVVWMPPDSPAAERRSARRRRWLLLIGLLLVVTTATAVFGLRTLRKQERLAQERAGFVAAVSHELRTPLTSTRLLGELLERGGLEEDKVREFGGRIARESEHLAQLVHNVLDLARLERVGLQAEDTERVLPGDLLREAAGLVVAGAEQPAVRIVDAGLNARPIRVHRAAILAALRNLIENALHHAAESPLIELAANGKGRTVRFEVRDRGPGVAAEEREAIFREFRRESARDRPSEDTRAASGGAGLGLALVVRIAKVHGGRAFHEPRIGGGSVFVVELPVAAADGGVAQ